MASEGQPEASTVRKNLPETEANPAENRAERWEEREALKILLVHLDPAVPEAVS